RACLAIHVSSALEACASGLSVSTSITPCGLILTARIALTGTPPLTTPLMARATSACLNVKGARGISPELRDQIERGEVDLLLGMTTWPTLLPATDSGEIKKVGHPHTTPPLSDLSDLRRPRQVGEGSQGRQKLQKPAETS